MKLVSSNVLFHSLIGRVNLCLWQTELYSLLIASSLPSRKLSIVTSVNVSREAFPIIIVSRWDVSVLNHYINYGCLAECTEFQPSLRDNLWDRCFTFSKALMHQISSRANIF